MIQNGHFRGKPHILQIIPLCLLVLALVTGCGYRLKSTLLPQIEGHRGIFVPVFENDTLSTGAEVVFTNALIRELTSRQELVVNQPVDGGLQLKGVLREITADPTAYTDTSFRGLQPFARIPTEYGVEVKISLALSRVDAKQLIWQKTFRGFRRVDAPTQRTYDYSSPSSVGLYTQSVVNSIYPQIADDIMRDVYDEMLELF